MDKNKPKRAPVKTDGPTLEETQADLLKLEILLAEASTWSHSTHDMYELRMKLVESSLSVTYWYINCDRSALSYSRRVAAWLQILLNNPPYYSTRQNIDFNLAPFAEPPFSNTPTAPTSNVPSNTPTAPTSNVPSNVSSNVPSNVPSNTPTAPTSNVPSNTQKMPGSRVVLESGVQGLVAALNASQGTGPAGVGNSGVGIPGEAGHGKSGGSGVGKGGAGDGGGLPMVRGSGVGKNGSAGQVAAVGSGVGKSGVGNGGGGAGAGLPSVGRSGVGNERVGGQVGSVVSVLGKDGVQGEVRHRGLGNSGQGKGGLAAIGGLGAERKGVVGNVEAVGVGGSGVARREGGEVESAGVGGSGAKGEVGNDRSGGGGSKAGRGGIGRTLVTGGVGGGGVGGIAGTKDKGPEGEAEDDELPHPEGDEGWESQDEGESSGNDDGPRNGKKRKTPRSSEDEGQPEDYDTDGEPQRKRKKMNSRKSSKYHKDVVRGANGQILPDPGLGLRRFPRPCGRCARSKWLCLMSSTIEKACWNCARSKLQCAFSNGGAVDTGTEAESPGIRTSPKRSLKAIKKEFAEGTVHTVKSKMPRRKKKDGDSEKVAKGKGKGKGKEKSRAREADGEEEDEEIEVDEDVLEEKLPKGKGKGKGKARATEADDEEGDEGVEVDEDLVEEEEAQYRAAVKLSLQAKRRAEKQSREGPIASTSQIPPVPTTAVIAHPRVLQLAAPARRSRGRSTSSAETVKDPEDDSNAMDVDTDPSRDGSKTVKGKGRAAVTCFLPLWENHSPDFGLATGREEEKGEEERDIGCSLFTP
ncbi:hypothetical protein DFP72DRAFT_1068317 [Ephemerocybe angulata]|uniref:Zn(2)-C6 fungal-type domain-containing protein n=1 Tax=Ephemerocybe angulata TaxID=980116 RepID=A0A8H6HYD1_9AGAR|nr:hypothetical protein DFP72DRAFT_1068317 [Tulosesus angulatus]